MLKWTGMPLLVLLAGCTTQMYAGKERPPAEVAKVYSRQNIGIRYLALDGRPLGQSTASLQRMTVLPGRHQFEVSISDAARHGTHADVRNTIAYFTLALEVHAGYAYQLDVPVDLSAVIPRELCFLGEPHDAPGSKVNHTGEIRTMSPAAPRVACAGAYRVTRPGAWSNAHISD